MNEPDKDKAESTDRLPELEIPCTHCDGSGDIGYCDGVRYRCPVCDGAGYEATEFGRRVLDLMRHHFRQMRDDIGGR